MDHSKPAAVTALREAVGAYYAYCESVENGKILVNSDDDPADLIEAARLNVGERIRACLSVGLSEDEVGHILAGDEPGAEGGD